MAPLPEALQQAIEKGELTEAQLRELITLEAQALGLNYDEAVKLAKERRLPKNHIGAHHGSDSRRSQFQVPRSPQQRSCPYCHPNAPDPRQGRQAERGIAGYPVRQNPDFPQRCTPSDRIRDH